VPNSWLTLPFLASPGPAGPWPLPAAADGDVPLANESPRSGAAWTCLTALLLFPFLPRELRLRNYEPEDEELKKRKVPQARLASGGCKWERGR